MNLLKKQEDSFHGDSVIWTCRVFFSVYMYNNKANSFQTVVFLMQSDILGHTISVFSFIFITRFCFPSPLFLGEEVNFLLRGANGLNNSETIYEKFIVSMLLVLPVNQRGHIPHRKKRAFILTNETRLLAFI